MGLKTSGFGSTEQKQKTVDMPVAFCTEYSKISEIPLSFKEHQKSRGSPGCSGKSIEDWGTILQQWVTHCWKMKTKVSLGR
jgi:hypothetical protein